MNASTLVYMRAIKAGLPPAVLIAESQAARDIVAQATEEKRVAVMFRHLRRHVETPRKAPQPWLEYLLTGAVMASGIIWFGRIFL